MIAHTQTYLGIGEAGAVPGNCMQAAVASLLDLPLEMVPHFGLFDDGEWRSAMVLWFRSRGKRLRVYNDWPEHVAAWQAAGIMVFPLSYAPSGQMMIASGTSPNGPWGHCVLWKSGELVHDTHPNPQGLASVPWEFWQVTDL